MANEQYPYSDLPEFTEANEDKNKITPLWANTYIRNTLNALKDELGSGPRGTAADLTTRLDLEHAGDGSHSLSLVLSENDIPDLPAYLKVNGTDHMEGNLDMRSYSLVGTSYKVAIGWNALEGTSYRTKIGTKENPPILPAMTTAERDALPAANGLVIYNTTENQCEEYGDGSWGAFGEAGSGHELLSATHTDTAASAVSRGSIIVGDSTPEWAELAVGGAGTYLKADGTDVAWGALGDHDHTGDAGDGGQLGPTALSGVPDHDHTGDAGDGGVIVTTAIQSRNIESAAPTSYETLTWDAAAAEWQGKPVDALLLYGKKISSVSPTSYETLTYDPLNVHWKADQLFYIKTLVLGFNGRDDGAQYEHVVFDGMGVNGTIVRARAYADTAPSGGTCIVDINVGSRGIAGTSIWAVNQGNRLTIADGTKDSGVQTSFDTVTIQDGQEITMDIDSSNSADEITVCLSIKVPYVV